MATGVYIRTKPVWNKGKKGVYSPEYLAKLVKSHTGKKQSAETVEKRVSKFRGDKHILWKGDNVGYFALHSWVRRILGKANKCCYCNGLSKSVTFHWANKSHQYKRELSDWMMLCVPCHSKYDRGLITIDEI